MITISKQYRKPVCIAILLHVALLVFCLIHLTSTTFRSPQAAAPMAILHATAIMKLPATPAILQQEQQKVLEQKLQEEKIEKQKAVALKQIEEKKKAAVLEKKALVLKQEKIAKLQQIEKIKKEKVQKLKKTKALALKKEQEKIAKAKAAKAAQAQKLLAEQKQLQQAMMQQTMQSDQKSLAVATLQQGQVDKYKAAILSLVQSNWRIDHVDDKLKCIYSVGLAPDGTVLSATLVKSSGDDNLDRSAREAIMQSSPLPVPHNPIVFNHFRQLILTLSPQGYVR